MNAAIEKVPSLSEKRVTPHLFRHTTAVHLVAAGVDVTVIRSWLGHASLDTTNHYAQANLETKRKALEQATRSCGRVSLLGGNETPICWLGWTRFNCEIERTKSSFTSDWSLQC